MRKEMRLWIETNQAEDIIADWVYEQVFNGIRITKSKICEKARPSRISKAQDGWGPLHQIPTGQEKRNTRGGDPETSQIARKEPCLCS